MLQRMLAHSRTNAVTIRKGPSVCLELKMFEEDHCPITASKCDDEESQTELVLHHSDEGEGLPAVIHEAGRTECLHETHNQGNPPPMFLVVESQPSTSYQSEEVDGHSEFIGLDDGCTQFDVADCTTREHSPDPESMHMSDIRNDGADETPQKDRENQQEETETPQKDKENQQKETMLVDDDPLTMCQVEVHHPGMTRQPVDKPICHSVEVQVSLGSNDSQEFRFTCDWERTGRFLGPRNAIVQCNVAKGWCIGVPKVAFIPPPTIPPKWSSKPAATVLHRKPVPIIVKDKNKQYGRNKMEHILFSRSIGIQCYLTPKRGYAVSSKGTQACLPISSYYNLSFLKKTNNADSVLSKKPQVQLPNSITITRVTPQNDREVEVSERPIPEPEVSVNTVQRSHKGFLGFESIERSNDQAADFKRLCGFGIDIFQTLLSKLDISGNITPLMSNKSVLLLCLMKLNLGISSSALGVLFGLDETEALDLVITTVRTLRTRIRNVLYMPSRATISNELPPYFQGVYKKSRVIVLCNEFVTEEPKTEADRVRMYSDAKGTYTFRSVIAMTPLGRVCFKSKPYRGQTSFGTILKECNIVGYLDTGDVVLAESLLSEMQIILQKGVLVVVPGSTQAKEEDGTRTRKSHRGNEDEYGAEVRYHIERCARRLSSVKLMREIPCSLFPYITELLQVWYSIINQMPPILRHDQPEE